MGLTPKQHAMLAFIQGYIDEHGYAPNFDEMMRALDLHSKSNVHRILQCLEERGYIRRLANKARAIEVRPPVQEIHPLDVFRLAHGLNGPERRQLLAFVAGLEAHADGDGGTKAAMVLQRIGDRLTGQPRRAAA